MYAFCADNQFACSLGEPFGKSHRDEVEIRRVIWAVF